MCCDKQWDSFQSAAEVAVTSSRTHYEDQVSMLSKCHSVAGEFIKISLLPSEKSFSLEVKCWALRYFFTSLTSGCTVQISGHLFLQSLLHWLNKIRFIEVVQPSHLVLSDPSAHHITQYVWVPAGHLDGTLTYLYPLVLHQFVEISMNVFTQSRLTDVLFRHFDYFSLIWPPTLYNTTQNIWSWFDLSVLKNTFALDDINSPNNESLELQRPQISCEFIHF